MLNEVHASILLPRQTDQATLFAAVRDMHCVSVVGVSNVGKSALLRSLTDPEIQREHLGDAGAGYVFIYMDFNQMLEMTEQGFCELMLRCSLEALRGRPEAADVFRQVQAAYNGLVAPASNFEIPLRFAQALAVIGDQLAERVVFLFDELDGPLARIDGRVFLNLRALKDRHPECLSYITATNSRLTQIRQDGDVGEFDELFAQHTHYLFPLGEDETSAFVAGFGAASGVTFSADDLSFISLWAGGHPGLLVSICKILGDLTGRPVREASQDVIIHRRAAELLSHDLNVQGECRKIWDDLTEAEQEALLAFLRSSGEEQLPDLDSVLAKHVIVGQGPERHIFARSFADFLRRQQISRRPTRAGLTVDIESGEVRLNGELAPTLTNLEYRLLLLLFGRLGKIVTKYEVVEAVWGEEYIDEVDDARIEKLVSRLRQKLEPDVNNPRYLLTVRGRGYKLVQA